MMTTALASVGPIRSSGAARSAADPIHRVAGHTAIATNGRDHREENSGAGAARRAHRASSAPLFGFNARSARWRIASRHKAYPG